MSEPAVATRACDPEEAFLAALMQDIGMLALQTALGPRYDDLLAQTNGNHFLLPQSENTSLRFTHAEVGARLGERWHLPDQLVEPIRHHHGTDNGRKGTVGTVVLSLQVSSLVTAPDRSAALDVADSISQSALDLSLADERSLLAKTCEDARELSALLEVKVGEHPDVAALLAEADDALIKHQVDVQREGEHLRQSRRELAKEALTDGLTGIGNRKHFDQELTVRFEQAMADRGRLGLILVDVDRFKLLNDTHGHPAGDRALTELAGRLREGVQDAGLVCRYGGEEFAIIMPSASRVEAAMTAERLRKEIAQQQFDLGGVAPSGRSVRITVSFGVAALEPAVAHLLHHPDVIVNLADSSLYAAKKAGRNCVRVFSPKPRPSAAV
ncbi:MAG: sensor domain-containing diguanylate cyclase [Planctomycetota bacterium]